MRHAMATFYFPTFQVMTRCERASRRLHVVDRIGGRQECALARLKKLGVGHVVVLAFNGVCLSSRNGRARAVGASVTFSQVIDLNDVSPFQTIFRRLPFIRVFLEARI
jgi:hypothetical protein